MYIKVKRDADEQEVLHQVTSKLAGHISHLTVHITKDEWSVSPLSHHGTAASKIHLPNINNPLLTRLGGTGSVSSAARLTNSPAVGNQQSYVMDMSTKPPSTQPQATNITTVNSDNTVVTVHEKV